MSQRRFFEKKNSLLRYALDQVREAAFLVDAKGSFLYANREASRSLGYSSEELMGMSIHDINPDYTDKILAQRHKELCKHGSLTSETRHRTKDGRIFPVEITSSLVELDGINGSLSLVRDISERKQAEKELQVSRDYLESIINAIAAPVFVKDADHRYIVVNDAFCIQAGRLREEILGKSDYDLFPRAYADILRQADDQVLISGKPSINEEQISVGVGSLQTVITHKSRYIDPFGNRFILGVIRNISELKKMEDQLATRERLLSALLDNFPDYVVRLDVEGRHIFVNQALIKDSGIPFEAFVGKTLPSLKFGNLEQNMYLHRTALRAAAQGEINTIETLWQTRGGNRYFEIRYIPEKDVQGKVVSVLAIARDITEKKQIEYKLRESEACYRQSSNLLASILESSPTIGVFALDREFRYLAFNQRHRKKIAYIWGKDIAIGMSLLDAVDSDECREKIRKVCDEVMTGCVISGEAQLVSVKEGRRISEYYTYNGAPIFDDDENVVGLTIFTVNITERKEMEEQLRFSEQQFRTLTENSPGMIIRYDLDCRRVYVNPAFSRETGIKTEVALGVPLENFWIKAANMTAKEVADILRRVMTTGVPEELLMEWPNRNMGRLSCHIFYVVAEKNGDGEICGCLAIDHDITRLRETELKLAKLAEIIPGFLCNSLMRPDGSFCMPYASHRIEDLSGLRPGDLTQDMSAAFKLVHPDEQQHHIESIMESARTLSLWRQEFRVRNPVKGEIWVEGLSIPERQPDGGVMWFGFFHDITARKRLELVNVARLRLLQFAETHSLSEVLEATLNEAEILTGSQIGFYIVLLEDRKTLKLQNWLSRTMRDYCKFEGTYLYYDISESGVWGDCVRQRKGGVHNDYVSLPHPNELLRADHAPLNRELVVPVLRGENVVAILAVGNRSTDYTTRDVETISILADFAWEITCRKRSEEELLAKQTKLAALKTELSLAEERERQNIATTLHDHIGQTLLLSRIKLDALSEEQLPECHRETLQETIEILDKVAHEIHNLTVQINPPVLVTAGLEAALKWLGRRMEEDYCLCIEFVDDMQEKPLLDEIRSVIYQCGRELLINVAKHAKTDHARIIVGRDNKRYRLTVEDDGSGFDPAALAPDTSKDCRFGLLSIQIRMERIGGSVIFESSPGRGSRMTLLAPIVPTERQEDK